MRQDVRNLAACTAAAPNTIDSEESEREGNTMQPLVRAEPLPEQVPTLKLNGTAMTLMRYEWLQGGEFIQGGPSDAGEAAALLLGVVGNNALSSPFEFVGFGTAPGNVMVSLYSDRDENGAPSGSEERVDCSFPVPPDVEKCEWQEGPEGLTLTVRPDIERPAVVTITTVYVIPLDQLPENANRTVLHGTWIIAR